MDSDLVSLWLTLKLAGATTLVLIVLGTPLAWWLSQRSHSSERGWLRNTLQNIVEPLVALPIVLPPTVVGFYLLLAFSPNNLPGELWQSATGTTLAFSFYGLVVGSTIYSLPFYVQPLQVAFGALQRELIEAAGPVLQLDRSTLPSRFHHRHMSVLCPYRR